MNNYEETKKILQKIEPEYIFIMSGISSTVSIINSYYYNLLSMISNIFESLSHLSITPKKIVIPSSSHVYGENNIKLLNENLKPKPNTDYALSKFFVEQLSKNWFNKFPIILTRPFNYTGVGQNINFVIPKIIKHFKEKKSEIELGNINLYREFNDVRSISKIYRSLIESDYSSGIVNLSYGKGYTLQGIINKLKSISGDNIKIKKNNTFIRYSEPKFFIGSPNKLGSIIGKMPSNNIDNLLNWMLYEETNHY